MTFRPFPVVQPWNGLDASAFLVPADPAAAADNLKGLALAYTQAQSQGVGLLIPPGTYWVDFGATLSLTVPLVGAGSGETVIQFKYPSSAAGVLTAFSTEASATDARLQGLTLVGPDGFRGERDDGSDARPCWAMYVQDGTKLTMIDVHTTNWNQAVKIDGSHRGASVYLQGCYIKSLGTRIYHEAPALVPDPGGLTIVDCDIEQDEDGFVTSWSAVHPGIHAAGTVNLRIIGGRSLGVAPGNQSADIYSPDAPSDYRSSLETREILVTGHYFGPRGYLGADLSPAYAAVLLDSCIFAGTNGLVIGGGAACSVHVSNCAFVGGPQPASEWYPIVNLDPQRLLQQGRRDDAQRPLAPSEGGGVADARPQAAPAEDHVDSPARQHRPIRMPGGDGATEASGTRARTHFTAQRVFRPAETTQENSESPASGPMVSFIPVDARGDGGTAPAGRSAPDRGEGARRRRDDSDALDNEIAEPAPMLASYPGVGVAGTDQDVEAYFTNCKFGAALHEKRYDAANDQTSWTDTNGYVYCLLRKTGAKTWSFSNCYFGGLLPSSESTDTADRRLVKAWDGVNIFHHCRFVDDREQQDSGYTLEQHAGRVELYQCEKVGAPPLCFTTDRRTGDGYKGVEVVLEGCRFLQDSLMLRPGGPITIRGSENTFGDYVSIDAYLDASLVSSEVQLRRGRSHQRVQRWSRGTPYDPGDLVRNGDAPERVYECTSATRATSGSGSGPDGTSSSIADGAVTWRYVRDDADYEYEETSGGPLGVSLERLTLSWNADWVELDEPNASIREIRMRAAAGTTSVRAQGSTMRLFAVQAFTLKGSADGNIQMSMASGSITYSADQVATLRYSPLSDRWVLL
jgi:hypothetical protein